MPTEPWVFTHLTQEYCKDTSCATCEGTGSYYSEDENTRMPCVQDFEKSTGREVAEGNIYHMNCSGDDVADITVGWTYVDDGTPVPDAPKISPAPDEEPPF